MDTSPINPSARVAVCDSRGFDRQALSEALALGNLRPDIVTGEPAAVVGWSARTDGDVIVVVGSRVLREDGDLPARIRAAHARSLIIAIGVDEPGLRRAVDELSLDGYVRRDADIDEILRVMGRFAVC